MLRFGIAVAAILVVTGIALGTLQAEDELTAEKDKDTLTPTPTVVALSQPSAAEAEAAPYAPPELPAYLPPAPPREYELTGSDILYRVRGGDDSCRFLYTGNRIGTHAASEIGLWFVAGVWEADLEQYDELHLYGPNGPHLFEIEGPGGSTLLSLHVDYGATEYATVTFPVPGMYYLFDRERLELGVVGEITVSPAGQPGGVAKTGWCPDDF
jgi:hypothetical protein